MTLPQQHRKSVSGVGARGGLQRSHLPRQFEIQSGQTACTVGGQTNGDFSPADEKIGVVVHLFGQNGCLLDEFNARQITGETVFLDQFPAFQPPGGKGVHLVLDGFSTQEFRFHGESSARR